MLDERTLLGIIINIENNPQSKEGDRMSMSQKNLFKLAHMKILAIFARQNVFISVQDDRMNKGKKTVT